jgi:hypothetical protein
MGLARDRTQSNTRLWAMGEALVDGVFGRYPKTSAVPFPDDENVERQVELCLTLSTTSSIDLRLSMGWVKTRR